MKYEHLPEVGFVRDLRTSQLVTVLSPGVGLWLYLENFIANSFRKAGWLFNKLLNAFVRAAHSFCAEMGNKILKSHKIKLSTHFTYHYSCGLSTATIKYSCLSV